MPRVGGKITRRRILVAAERLFSERGFDGTGMEQIAAVTGINKASIYFHFKSKTEIMNTLVAEIIAELNSQLKESFDHKSGKPTDMLMQKIQAEVDFAASKKSILTIMLMESLKSGSKDDFLLRCGELIMENELETHLHSQNRKKMNRSEKEKFLLHEFFTGFLPIICYSILREKWCKYFQCRPERMDKYFIESFQKTHLASHALTQAGDRVACPTSDPGSDSGQHIFILSK